MTGDGTNGRGEGRAPVEAIDPHLIVERVGHVLVLTMNRPQARNAFSPEMLVRMDEAWAEAEEDDDVRVVILTGAGGCFSAGADLKSMFNPDPDDPYTARFQADADLAWRALLRHRRLTKPLLAAVEGPCIAGGTEILQATDIRVAGQSATFGIAEARWGLFPLGGSTVRLRRQVAYAKAMEILLTGEHFPASEALRIDLINRVVPDGEALTAAREIAARISANGPLAVRAIKRSVIQTEGRSEEEALRIEMEIGMQVFASEDAREGPRAFAEKRPPNFRGR